MLNSHIDVLLPHGQSSSIFSGHNKCVNQTYVRPIVEKTPDKKRENKLELFWGLICVLHALLEIKSVSEEI